MKTIFLFEAIRKRKSLDAIHLIEDFKRKHFCSAGACLNINGKHSYWQAVARFVCINPPNHLPEIENACCDGHHFILGCSTAIKRVVLVSFKAIIPYVIVDPVGEATTAALILVCA